MLDRPVIGMWLFRFLIVCTAVFLVMLYAMLSFDKLSNETHFVGLSFEKAAARRSALAYARTFASRKVFSPTHMSPEKMVKTLFAPAGANSARLFSPSVSFADSSAPLSVACGDISPRRGESAPVRGGKRVCGKLSWLPSSGELARRKAP